MGTRLFLATIFRGINWLKKYEIVAVVTQPDRLVGRKKFIDTDSVENSKLIKHKLLVLQPEKIMVLNELEKVIEMQPDLLITAAFGQFLTAKTV